MSALPSPVRSARKRGWFSTRHPPAPRGGGGKGGFPPPPPPAGVVAEVRHDHRRRLEGAVAVVERDPAPGVAEADDVRPPVARQVGEEAGVFLAPPPAGVVAEV